MTGDLRVETLEIDPDAVDPEDVEMLQDLIIAAVNEAIRKAEELQQSRLGGAEQGGFDPMSALESLGLGGMAVALRAFVGLVSASRAWYAPTVTVIGLIGLVCTIAAFASVHKRRLPFALLGAASVSLVLGWIVTGL